MDHNAPAFKQWLVSVSAAAARELADVVARPCSVAVVRRAVRAALQDDACPADIRGELAAHLTRLTTANRPARRDAPVLVKFSADEKARVAERARAANVAVATYIRACALGEL
jgi:hypothetical protein